MSFRGASDVPVEIIGGLVCDTAAVDLPAWVSPDCQDVDFGEDGARTRPGLGAPLVRLAGNVVNYLKTFVTANGTQRAMAFTDLANLYKETAPGVFGIVASLPDVNIAAPYANSTTQFSKEWLAIGDGQYGVGLPRQYDDTNLDRVSQCGPGAAPGVADENLVLTELASPNGASQTISTGVIQASPTGLTQVGNIVTVQFAGNFSPGAQAGDLITIVGAGVGGYNGTFTILTVTIGPTETVTYYNPTSGLAASGGGNAFSNLAQLVFTAPHGLTPVNPNVNIPNGALQVMVAGNAVAGYNGTWSVRNIVSTNSIVVVTNSNQMASSGGGTATVIGNVAVGVHQLTVIFVTRSQFLTAPAPPAKWTAAGGKRAVVSGIPIGPPNVIQRILVFTGAGGATFYYLTGVPQILNSNFVISDNVTTAVTVDFSDGILASGVSADYLFNQVELGECAGVLDYSDRLLWWGERAKVQNAVNLTFDGGFTNLTSATTGTLPNFPLGWTQDAVFAPGGASALVQGLPVVWGDAYAIFGNGSMPTRGKITQNVAQDFRLVPVIQANTGYSVRGRLARNAALNAGTLHLNLQSTIQGFTTAGLQVTAAQATQGYVEFTALLTAPLATVPSDLNLQLYADGTPNAGGAFLIDCIEIFPTNQPKNGSVVRVSRAGQPESYDGVTGLLQPSQNNGQAVRSAYRFRNGLVRIVKEHSLYSTQDNGTTEPSDVGGGWNVTEASQIVGTPSVRGVGIGEDWAVIAHRTGLYIDWGTEPQKISQEIGHSSNLKADGVTPLTLAWDQINWNFGYTIWVTVDTTEKRILVGAPFGMATSPNAILMLDYRKIDPDEGGTGAEAIAANGPIRIRYTGMKAVMDKSRKWSPWTPSVNSCALIERPDGTAHVWMGAGAGVPAVDSGGIYDLQRSNLTDYSTRAQIPFYYWTAFTPQREQNQQIQTHEHRKSFKYLTAMAEGAGMMDLSAAPGNFNTYLSPRLLPSLFLSNPAPNELETNIDVKGERVAFRISASSPDGGITTAWIRVLKLTLSVMGDPTTPVRGVN